MRRWLLRTFGKPIGRLLGAVLFLAGAMSCGVLIGDAVLDLVPSAPGWIVSACGLLFLLVAASAVLRAAAPARRRNSRAEERIGAGLGLLVAAWPGLAIGRILADHVPFVPPHLAALLGLLMAVGAVGAVSVRSSRGLRSEVPR